MKSRIRILRVNRVLDQDLAATHGRIVARQGVEVCREIASIVRRRIYEFARSSPQIESPVGRRRERTFSVREKVHSEAEDSDYDGHGLKSSAFRSSRPCVARPGGPALVEILSHKTISRRASPDDFVDEILPRAGEDCPRDGRGKVPENRQMPLTCGSNRFAGLRCCRTPTRARDQESERNAKRKPKACARREERFQIDFPGIRTVQKWRTCSLCPEVPWIAGRSRSQSGHPCTANRFQKWVPQSESTSCTISPLCSQASEPTAH